MSYAEEVAQHYGAMVLEIAMEMDIDIALLVDHGGELCREFGKTGIWPDESKTAEFAITIGRSGAMPTYALAHLCKAAASWHIWHHRTQEDGDYWEVLTPLIEFTSKAFGAAIAVLPDNDARKKSLSEAGAKGAASKHRQSAELKKWALKLGKDMKDQDADIARKLSARVPEHLKDASSAPERLIYEALRAQKKIELIHSRSSTRNG